jgi:hypothetical protein
MQVMEIGGAVAAILTHPWRAPANLDATVASLGVEVTDLRRTLIDAGKASTGPHDTLPPPTCFGAEAPLDGALLKENALLDRGCLYKTAHPGPKDTIVLARARGSSLTRTAASRSAASRPSGHAHRSGDGRLTSCGVPITWQLGWSNINDSRNHRTAWHLSLFFGFRFPMYGETGRSCKIQREN